MIRHIILFTTTFKEWYHRERKGLTALNHEKPLHQVEDWGSCPDVRSTNKISTKDIPIAWVKPISFWLSELHHDGQPHHYSSWQSKGFFYKINCSELNVTDTSEMKSVKTSNTKEREKDSLHWTMRRRYPRRKIEAPVQMLDRQTIFKQTYPSPGWSLFRSDSVNCTIMGKPITTVPDRASTFSTRSIVWNST